MELISSLTKLKIETFRIWLFARNINFYRILHASARNLTKDKMFVNNQNVDVSLIFFSLGG